MLTNDYYPTPSHVTIQMIAGIDFRLVNSVLEPSAGEGAICDYLTNYHPDYRGHSHRYSKVRLNDLYCIESDLDRVAVLRDKGYKVIDYDFLNHNPTRIYDLIVMNPPFDQGARHLLKAWDISDGALIKCLLNAETLNNLYSQERLRLKRIIDEYGSIEDLGQCFKDAPRRTNVEVVLVTLQDTRPKAKFRLEFDPETQIPTNGQYSFGNIPLNQLASSDIFESYESQYRAAVAAFAKMLEAMQEVKYYSKGLMNQYKDTHNVIGEILKKHGGVDTYYNEFTEQLSEMGWGQIFEKTKLAAVTTENVRKQLSSLQDTQGKMAFTAHNMKMLLTSLGASKQKIMLDCVMEAFDLMTRHFHNNWNHQEGWKTNASAKVGSKFILPYIGSTSWGGIDWSYRGTLADIEKAMCLVAGKHFDSIVRIDSVYEKGKFEYGQWYTSEFFETRLYKKGTMHFKFLDENLRDDFNMLVAEHRPGWLAEKNKTGAYE